jgi:hypothetical protein
MTQGTEGCWHAMATLSPVNPRWASIANRLWPFLKRQQEKGRFLPTDATKLSMIGFARWSLVWKVPPPPEEGSQTLQDAGLPTPYILFETNYNGDTDQYFESFSYVSERSIELVWRGTYGMPRVKKVGAFIKFINENKSPPVAFFTAYPQESAKTIRSSLELKWLHDSLKGREPEMDDAEFLAEYQKFLREAQKQNPPLRPPYVGKHTGVFTAITPFAITRKDDLEDELEQPRDWPDTTHFARLIPIHEVMWRTLPQSKFEEGRQPIRPCLVFGASFDGDKEVFLQELYEHQSIWRHCDNWPGEDGNDDVDSFVDYLRRHEYKFDFPYSPYDGVPREAIECALDLSNRVWEFAEDNQKLTIPTKAGELRDAWGTAFQS